MLVYVPLNPALARTLRTSGPIGALNGCAATEEFVRGLGPGVSQEEAEYAALTNAGVLGLVSDGGAKRLVLAADVDSEHLATRGGAAGQVLVHDLRWPQVTALFADEAAAADLVARAGAAVAGRSLADALASSEVGELLDEYDLLWFDPAELDQL